MKKLSTFLLALALLIPTASQALTGKGVILINKSLEDPAGVTFNRLVDRSSNIIHGARELGMNVDIIAAGDTGAYGAVGVPDSAWFRQRYDYMIIPAQGPVSNTANHFRNKVYLGFRQTGRGGAIMVDTDSTYGPYTGKWDIPIFVWAGVDAGGSDCINNSTMKFANGITGVVGGLQTISTKMQASTSACPTYDGTKGDTIFVNSRQCLRDMTDGRIQVLLGGVNGNSNKPAAAGDTVSYWRWRPDATKPGVYWFSVRENNPTGDNPPTVWGTAEAMIWGQVCQVVGIRPPSPIVAWFDMDHVHPQSGTVINAGRSQPYNVRDMAALGDSLRNWGWTISAPTQCGAQIGNATLTSDNGGNGFVQDSVKTVVKKYRDVFAFHVHDHFDANTSDWRSQGYDTTIVCRPGYNSAVASAADSRWKNLLVAPAGSFGFYETLPQDDGDYRAVKVFGDAGVRGVRILGGISANQSAADMRAGKMTLPAYGMPSPFRSIGPNPQIIWGYGGLAIASASIRNLSGGTSAYWNPGSIDYQTAVAGWLDTCYPIWWVRGSAYFHGNENFQGFASAPDYQAWPIMFLKHTKNYIKLTAPAIVPMTALNANQYKAASRISGQ